MHGIGESQGALNGGRPVACRVRAWLGRGWEVGVGAEAAEAEGPESPLAEEAVEVETLLEPGRMEVAE